MNFEDKYKERKPEETINILLDFFKDLNFDIIYRLTENDCKTWSANIKLYKNSELYFFSNGKGVNPEFALASGLAEMYERFCGVCSWHSDDMTRINILRKKGVNNYLDKHLVEYKNVVDNSIIKLDEREVLTLQGSNGLAAGNNFYEAFNQGMSELCERVAHTKILENNNQTLYSIKIDAIKNNYLKAIINNFKNNNKDLKIIDFGYTWNIPVVGILVIDKIMKRFVLTYGCFPVFDIALERCLTETNQGVGFVEGIKREEIQKPFRNNQIEKGDSYQSTVTFFNNNESIIDNIKEKDAVSNVYANNNLNNTQIYNYWIEYLKNNSINVYYRNLSMSNKIFALSLYSPIGMINYNYKISENQKLIMNNQDIIKNINIIYESIYGDYDFRKYCTGCLNLLKYGDNTIADIINTLLVSDFMHGRFDKKIFIQNINDTLDKVITGTWNRSTYYDDLLFVDLDRFNVINRYNNASDLVLLSQITGYQYSSADLANRKNKLYLLENIFYKRMWNYYRSKDLIDNVKIMEKMYDRI